MNLGSYKALNIASVRQDSKKTIEFLKNYLNTTTTFHKLIVIFLGESHSNQTDIDVTKEILIHPPLIDEYPSMLYLERGLQYVHNFRSYRQEAIEEGMNRQARSKMMADKIQDYFTNNDVTLIYVACGDAHGLEIFNAMNKRMRESFTFIHKPSSVL